MLEARTGIIRDFCDLQNYQLEIACVVEMYDETAGMHLSRDVIAWLHGLGASLEIDTYMVAE